MKERVLLITGASSDVGMGILQDIYMEYECIFLHYRTMNDSLAKFVEKHGNEVKLIPIQADFAVDSDVDKLIETIEISGYLPNNIIHLTAPKAYNQHFEKDSIENYDLAWKVSVRSITKILQKFLPNMKKNKYGRIVFMLSAYTLNIPPKYQVSYCTIKYSLLGMVKALSSEYISKGITVNGISPQMMETKFLSDIPQLIVEETKNRSPIGRTVCIEEIIPLVKYMLSGEGAAFTGQNVGITGGL